MNILSFRHFITNFTMRIMRHGSHDTYMHRRSVHPGKGSVDSHKNVNDNRAGLYVFCIISTTVFHNV